MHIIVHMLPLEDRDDVRFFARVIHGANGGTPYSEAQALHMGSTFCGLITRRITECLIWVPPGLRCVAFA